MMGYELSLVEEPDIGMMAPIHALSFDDAWTGAMIRRILAMPGAHGIVARHERKRTVAGFTLLRHAADECEVLSLAVSPELRGDGLGGFLLDGAIEYASAGGATKLFLEVAEDNDIARRLYSGRGLEPVGRRPDYYTRKDGTTAAALTMSCQLEIQAMQAPG